MGNAVPMNTPSRFTDWREARRCRAFAVAQLGWTQTAIAAQRETLVTLLTQGAEAHGMAGDMWTNARVATLFTQQFGVTLCDRQVRRLLRERWPA